MWTNTPEGNQLVSEISKDVVAQLAPEELEMFDELSHEHFQIPEPSNSDDEPLGFGGDMLVAVTPLVVLVVQAVVKFIGEEVLKATKEESSALIAKKVKAIFNPSDEDKGALPTLTKEQLETIKNLVRKEAQRGGMKRKKAENMALMITARLAMAG